MSTSEPSWDLYETFLEVARGGSLSAASRTLGVAQPTARRRIEALEAALGVVLFTRAPSGLMPTEAALAMVPHAEAMASTARALARAVSGSADGERGTLRLATSEVVGVEVIPPILGALRARHPALQIELVLSDRNEDLLRRDADVAVRMVAPTQGALVSRHLGTIPIGLFASESYLAARGVPEVVDDLLEHDLIGPDRGRALLEALASVGLTTSRRHYALRTDDDVAQLAAIRAGLGVGACQVPLARRSRLTRVLPELVFPLGVWVVMHEDLRGSRRARLLFDHLVEALGAYIEGAAEEPSRVEA